jgi:hypothetical protein
MAGLVGPAIRIPNPVNDYRHLALNSGARVATMRRLVCAYITSAIVSSSF